MTIKSNARISGITFLAYIAAGVTSMVISGRVLGGEGMAEQLAAIAGNPDAVGTVLLLGLVQSFAAIVLGVTLWSITRDVDRELAMFAMICRVCEGLLGSRSVPDLLAMRWLATTPEVTRPAAEATHLLGAYLDRGDVAFTAFFFAVGSTLFSLLLLRGRLIPAWLAWLGVVASLLLVVGLPLQLVGYLGKPLSFYMWLPMLLFEVPLAAWLIVKGVAQPVRSREVTTEAEARHE